MVYVENDPLVYLHAGALVTGSDHAVAVLADVREPAGMSTDSRVVVITDTSAAPVKTGEGKLDVMYDAADPRRGQALLHPG